MTIEMVYCHSHCPSSAVPREDEFADCEGDSVPGYGFLWLNQNDSRGSVSWSRRGTQYLLFYGYPESNTVRIGDQLW